MPWQHCKDGSINDSMYESLICYILHHYMKKINKWWHVWEPYSYTLHRRMRKINKWWNVWEPYENLQYFIADILTFRCHMRKVQLYIIKDELSSLIWWQYWITFKKLLKHVASFYICQLRYLSHSRWFLLRTFQMHSLTISITFTFFAGKC